MIQKVTISGYKRLGGLTLELGTLNALVGANDSGKSSVLQAIHLAVSVAQTQKLLGEKSENEVAIAAHELLYTPMHDLAKLRPQGIANAPELTTITMQLQAGASSHEAVITIRPGPHRTILTTFRGEFARSVLENLEKPFSVYVPGLSGLARTEREISYGTLRRSVARGDANLVLRNVLKMLSDDPSAWERFKGHLRRIFPAASASVRFQKSTDEYIEVFVEEGPRTLPLDACGTGLLQAIHIASYIALFEPTVLLLDEPDSHLHPNNQKVLVRMLGDISDLGTTQIILTTHSRHIVDAAREKARVFWVSDGQLVNGVGPELTARLLELGALDSIDHFANGALKCIVATEDDEKEHVECILWSSGFKQAETAVLSYSGASKIQAAVVVGQLLKAKAPNVRLLVHRDRDYLSDADVAKFDKTLTADGIEAFVTGPSDIEGYYVNPELIVEHTGLPIERSRQIVSAAITDVKDKSIKAMINLRTGHAFRAREAGQNIDHGEIAMKCQSEYGANEAQLVRGKLCLRRIRALLHQELRRTVDIIKPSKHLKVAELSRIADRVWPKSAPSSP